MKYLVVVRHGEYDSDGHLNDRGREQMSALADNLKPLTANASVEMLASIMARATESAEILGDALGVSYTAKSLLGESFVVSDLDSALALVDDHSESDVLITVTHMPFASFFPAYYCMNRLNMEVDLGSIKIVDKGQAVVVDCEEKTVTLVKP